MITFKQLKEKDTSQQQQKLMGLALAYKRGEVPEDEVSDTVKALADRMSEKDLEDFASTKHKGLPKKVDEGPFRCIGKMLMKSKLQKGMKRDDSEFEKIRKRPSGGSKGDDMEASIKSYQRKRSALDRLTKR